MKIQLKQYRRILKALVDLIHSKIYNFNKIHFRLIETNTAKINVNIKVRICLGLLICMLELTVPLLICSVSQEKQNCFKVALF